MRRWTVLLVSHDTEKPKSISVTERALKVAASVATVIVLVAAIGVGAIIAQLGRWGGSDEDRRRGGAPFAAPARTLPPDVDSLRQQVNALNGALDSIRDTDARLRALAGVPPADTVTLLQRWLPGRGGSSAVNGIFRRTRNDGRSEGAPAGSPAAAAIPESVMTRQAVARSRASADSLLEHASAVVNRLGNLADSAAARRAAPDSGRSALPRSATSGGGQQIRP